jgi:hypothetical protein
MLHLSCEYARKLERGFSRSPVQKTFSGQNRGKNLKIMSKIKFLTEEAEGRSRIFFENKTIDSSSKFG